MEKIEKYYTKKLERIKKEIKESYKVSYNKYEEIITYFLIAIELIKESQDLIGDKNYQILTQILEELDNSYKFKMKVIKQGQEEVLESCIDYQIRREELKIQKLDQKLKAPEKSPIIKPAKLEITHLPYKELRIKLKTLEEKEILSYQFITDQVMKPMRTIIEEFAKVNNYQILEENHISLDEYIEDIVDYELEGFRDKKNDLM